MMRNFGLTARPAVGGLNQPGGPHHGAGTRAGSVIPFPARSVEAPDHSLEPLDISNTLLDVAKVVGAALLVTVTGLGISAALFAIFFLEFH